MFLVGMGKLLEREQLPDPQVLNSKKNLSCSVMSDSLRLYGLQHARLSCPSLSPWVCSNSCPLSQAMPSNHFILCHPLLLLPSIFPSIRVFSKHPYLKMHVSPGRHQPPFYSQITGGGNLHKNLNRQKVWGHLTEFVERHRSVGRD